MEPAYLLKSFVVGFAGICNCATCGLGGGGGAWFCASPDDCAGACCAVWGPLRPGGPGGGVARILRSSLTSSSGCRDMATRSLSEMILLDLCGTFCKSGGSSRKVASLRLVEFFATTTVCQERY